MPYGLREASSVLSVATKSHMALPTSLPRPHQVSFTLCAHCPWWAPARLHVKPSHPPLGCPKSSFLPSSWGHLNLEVISCGESVPTLGPVAAAPPGLPTHLFSFPTHPHWLPHPIILQMSLYASVALTRLQNCNIRVSVLLPPVNHQSYLRASKNKCLLN